MAKELESIYKRLVKSKSTKIFKEYESNPNMDFRAYMDKTTDLLLKQRWDHYLTEDYKSIYLQTVPTLLGKNNLDDTISPYTKRELDEFYREYLLYFFCYLVSVVEIDDAFRVRDDLKGWLPLYVGDKYVGFLEKMFSILHYENYIKIKPQKLEALFLQLSLAGQALVNEKSTPEIISELTNSIVSKATVVVNNKTPNVLIFAHD